MAKTFILGVGAQRTGSTWLHAQLKKNRAIKMGVCKEHHVFDVLFTPYFPKYRSRLLARIEQGRESGESVAKELKLLSFLEDPENYFEYFDKLYLKNPATKAVGDMTPSYSMLDAKDFQFIRKGLTSRGFRVKVIFVMRDPVERAWSMFHQAAKVKRALESNTVRTPSMSTFTKPDAALRTRYDRTITELEKVFSTEDIFYAFYERFFTPKSYSKLERFLGIRLKTPDFQFVKNPSMLKGEIPAELSAPAARYYTDTYRFVHRRFGDHVLDIWPGFQELEDEKP